MHRSQRWQRGVTCPVSPGAPLRLPLRVVCSPAGRAPLSESLTEVKPDLESTTVSNFVAEQLTVCQYDGKSDKDARQQKRFMALPSCKRQRGLPNKFAGAVRRSLFTWKQWRSAGWETSLGCEPRSERGCGTQAWRSVHLPLVTRSYIHTQTHWR